MTTTFLSDEVISSTELRTNQKHWLEQATEKIITVVNGRKQFALVNREQISNLFAQKHYTELAIGYCQEIRGNTKKDTFPWSKYLNDEEKVEFSDEFLNAIMSSIITNDWIGVEHLIEDWKATALAIHDSTLLKALTSEEDQSKYAGIED
jgi:hypothetical protein